MMEYPKVYIIILNWNGLKDTIECLESLRYITYANYKVVVVDNDSRGDDVEVLKAKFGNYIHIIKNNRNFGFAEGSNIGIRYSINKCAEYSFLLNNDTIVDPEFLIELIKVAESDERIAAVCPKVYYYDDPHRIQLAMNVIDLGKGGVKHIGANTVDSGKYNDVTETEEVNGCAFLIRNNAIKQIGMLNPEYFCYFEETEWCVIALKKGYRLLFVPKSKVWHKVSRSAGDLSPFSIYYMTRNRILFMNRNVNRFRFIIFLIYFLTFQSPLSLLSFIFHKKASLILPYVKGIIYHVNFRKFESK